MKKCYRLIFFMLFSVIAVCMFSSFSRPSKTVVVEGHIKVYGNEPNTFLGIETVDGRQYKIVYEDELELSELQGQKVMLEGTVKKNSALKKNSFDYLKDGTLTVDSYTVE